MKERAGNDDEVTAPLQIASYHGSYPYPEDFDGSTSISEQVLETRRVSRIGREKVQEEYLQLSLSISRSVSQALSQAPLSVCVSGRRKSELLVGRPSI